MLARTLPVIAVLVGLAISAWFLWPRDRSLPPPPPPQPAATPTPQIAPAPASSSAPQHPIETKAETPLPALAASDPVLVDALAKVLGSAPMRKFLDLDEVARRFVATVDNLPRESYATRLNPVKPIGGQVVVEGEMLRLAAGNAARYGAFVRFVDAVDPAAAVALYKRFYPLFQQAYVDLGYPQGYFTDRLVAVIDHLLAAPDVRGPVLLTQPHVLYEFADPALQERSAGQKALIRMGPENAAKLKAKLQAIRPLLVTSR